MLKNPEERSQHSAALLQQTPASVRPAPSQNAPERPWLKKLLAYLTALLLVGSVILVVIYTLLKPVLDDLLNPQTPEEASHLAEKFLSLEQGEAPQFQVLHSFSVLNLGLSRIRSLRQPQYFIVLSGLDKETAADLFSRALSPEQMETFANQYHHLTHPGDERTVSVRSVRLVANGLMNFQGVGVPFQQFRFSTQWRNQLKTGDYHALVEWISLSNPKKEVLVLTYAPETVPLEESLAQFAEHIRLH